MYVFVTTAERKLLSQKREAQRNQLRQRHNTSFEKKEVFIHKLVNQCKVKVMQ